MAYGDGKRCRTLQYHNTVLYVSTNAWIDESKNTSCNSGNRVIRSLLLMSASE
jgi:hypothetical protein